MKFGLMYEIQVPEPHYDGIEQERYKQVMAQVELADEVGFAYFWTVEHHFLREFSHCSAPEVLYGALSQRTKRIRIGHAVALLPGQYNHPVRVAERAAVLDIVSDGRMDLGTGRSTTLIEMDGFQVDPEETRSRVRDVARQGERGVVPGEVLFRFGGCLGLTYGLAIDAEISGEEAVQPGALLRRERCGLGNERGDRRRDVLAHAASASNICRSACVS